MSFNLLVGGTVVATTSTGAAVAMAMFGDEIATSPANSFKTIFQGLLAAGPATIYTVTGPVTQTIVKTVTLVNTSASPVTVTLFANGSAGLNRIPGVVVQANGAAIWETDGWRNYDANGVLLSAAVPITASGDATGTQSGSNLPLTLATVNGAPGTFGSATQVSQVTVNAKGLATTVASVSIQIAESQVTNLVTDLAGKQPTGNYITALTGDATATGPGSVAITLATVNASAGTFGSATQVAQVTVNAKGLATTVANVSIQIAESQVTNLVTDLAGKQATGNYITALTGDATATGPGSVALTLATVNGSPGTFGSSALIPIVTVNGKGLVTSVTTASFAAGLTGWVDVTKFPGTPVLPGNTAAQNITAINAILAASGAGNTIYFPGGTYSFNAAWTMPAAKQFTFQGQGPGLSGGNTLLQWTSNVAGTWITLAGSTFYYYFRDLTFVSTGVAQTAGAVVDVNGNATTNFYNCHFTGLSGGTLNDVLVGTNTGFGQSWNTSVISDCVMNSYKGRGIFIDSAGASLTVANSVIQGAWGPSSAGIFTGAPGLTTQAAAGIQANNCGALQVNDCDVLGNVNNLLLSPAVGQVNASCFVTNTYFDSSGGSCFKIAGAGATVRVRFDTCSFTTAGTNYSTPGSGFSAIENAGTFVFAAGGQSVAFTNCNILNTFATAGATNGVLISGTWADWYFTNCNVAAWTTGMSLTPNGTNISMMKVGFGAVGPSAGYGANNTGFIVGAGSYKGLQIQGVSAHGNTSSNLTLGTVTVAAADAGLFRITDNSGINPKGSVTTPGVPTAGTVVTNTTGFRVLVVAKYNATAPAGVVINGIATSAGLANEQAFITLEPGGTIAFTTTTVLSWVWVGQ